MELDRLKDIRLHGLAKAAHCLFMFVTFPIRHPFRFLTAVSILLLVLAVIPISRGVSWKNIPDWYLGQHQVVRKTVRQDSPFAGHDVVSQPIKAEVEAVVDVVSEAERPIEIPKPRHFEPMNLPKQWTKRAAPDDDTSAAKLPQTVEVSSEMVFSVSGGDTLADNDPENVAEAEADIVIDDENAEKVSTVSKPAYRKLDSLPLVYEENIKVVKGKPMIFSANEMTVGKTYLFLYGIYTDPQKYRGDTAQRYLEKLVYGQEIECYLVAYTYKNLPTAVCYLGDLSINQKLVDAGFADNVAL